MLAVVKGRRLKLLSAIVLESERLVTLLAQELFQGVLEHAAGALAALVLDDGSFVRLAAEAEGVLDKSRLLVNLVVSLV